MSTGSCYANLTTHFFYLYILSASAAMWKYFDCVPNKMILLILHTLMHLKYIIINFHISLIFMSLFWEFSLWPEFYPKLWLCDIQKGFGSWRNVCSIWLKCNWVSLQLRQKAVKHVSCFWDVLLLEEMCQTPAAADADAAAGGGDVFLWMCRAKRLLQITAF